MVGQGLVAVFLKLSEEDVEEAVLLCWDASLVLKRSYTSGIYFRFGLLDEIKRCSG